MILFVPAYDDATSANLSVASRLEHARIQRRLFREDATRQALVEALAETMHPDGPAPPLFAMSHGRLDELLAQGGEAAVGLPDWLWLPTTPTRIPSRPTSADAHLGQAARMGPRRSASPWR